MVNFETDRLHLHPIELTDLNLFLTLNRKRQVRKYLWDDEVISLSQARDILELNQSQLEQNRYGLWKIVPKVVRQVVGYTGLWHFFEESQPQLIYALLPQFWGWGFAAEASAAVIQYSFESLKFPYLIASMDEGHQASQKVARRLGMKLYKKQLINSKPTLFYKLTP